MDLFENLDRIFISKGEGSFEEWPLLLACLTFYLALRLLIKSYEEPLGRLDMRTTIWWRKTRDCGKRSVAKGIRRVLVFVQEVKEERTHERKHSKKDEERICGNG